MANVRANSMACHPRVTCHIAGCNNSIRHIENRFSPYFLFFCKCSLGFDELRLSYRLRSDTLVINCVIVCILNIQLYKTSFTTDIYYVSNCFYCQSPGETVMMLSAACQRWLCFLAIACCCHYIMNYQYASPPRGNAMTADPLSDSDEILCRWWIPKSIRSLK